MTARLVRFHAFLLLAIIGLSEVENANGASSHIEEKSRTIESGFVDEPRGCYFRVESPCSLRMIGRIGVPLSWAGHQLTLKPGSILTLEGSHQIKFIEGEVWVERGDHLKVKLGKWQVTVAGESWIQAEKSGAWLVRNLRGENQVHLDKLDEVIPVGFENWYGGLGVNDRGIVRPIAAVDFWAQWNRLVKWPQKQAVSKIVEYRRSWAEAVGMSSKLYQNAVQRKIASDEDQAEKKRMSQVKAEEERKTLQNSFRKKYYNP